MEERAAAAENTLCDQGRVGREYLHDHRRARFWWQREERGGWVLCCSPCLCLFCLLELVVFFSVSSIPNCSDDPDLCWSET